MQQRLDIENQAAATILERGARIPLRAPRFLRLFGKKEISVVMRPAPLGRLIEVSRVFTSMNVEVEYLDNMNSIAINKFIIENTKPVVEMMAIMLFGKSMLLPFYRRWLMKNITSRKFADMVKVIIAINGVENFMVSIVLMGQMRMTQPRTSPMENRSQETEW